MRPSRIAIDGTMARVELTNGPREALIDAADVSRVISCRWFVDSEGYVSTTTGGRQRRMHRELGPAAPQVDHANGDRLDNRRCNLRASNAAHNGQNRCGANANTSTGYRKVYKSATPGRWRAQVVKNKVTHHLGTFDTPEEAAAAAAEWRRENMPHSR